MMLTFKAKRSTEFFYNTQLEGDIWIVEQSRAHTPTLPAVGVSVVVVPFEDLLEFAARVSGVPEPQSEQAADDIMRFLDRLGAFEPGITRAAVRAQVLGLLRK